MRTANGRRPATLRQLVLLDVALMLAVGFMFLRPSLPRWAKPEAYGFAPAAQSRVMRAGPLTAEHTLRAGGTTFRDHAILAVGDSSLEACPWRADRVSYPGYTTEALITALEEAVSDREYECIILWPGTWDMMQRRPAEEFVEAAIRLARIAQQHAESVVLIGPMPAATPETVTAANAKNVATITAAMAELHKRLPDVRVYDMTDFRRMAEREGTRKALYLDNLHINRQGFEVLAHTLDLPELTGSSLG